jgi:hypothetical protein
MCTQIGTFGLEINHLATLGAVGNFHSNYRAHFSLLSNFCSLSKTFGVVVWPIVRTQSDDLRIYNYNASVLYICQNLLRRLHKYGYTVCNTCNKWVG